MDELLRKVPMIRSVVGRSRTEQRGAWHDWRQECRRRRDRGDFVGCPQLHLLCGVSTAIYNWQCMLSLLVRYYVEMKTVLRNQSKS